MAYCTLAQLIERYTADDLAVLTDRSDGLPPVIDQAVIERAIADADAEIDMYLMARYKLPLVTVPLALVNTSCILAYANLNPHQAKDSPAMENAARQRDKLQLLAEGKLSLGLDEGKEEAPIANTVQISEGRNDFKGRY